ncbi:uncharacterized protein LOC124253727 [Haliotis rubra]|uniref:uncharacterized protein LOC124253727 n=1 Tax=Haliotis rubra TaxID=36100 RepID=UPI001EE56364|nr:uncharacterized protein LOC124253727 [Haliotis rubra]
MKFGLSSENGTIVGNSGGDSLGSNGIGTNNLDIILGSIFHYVCLFPELRIVTRRCGSEGCPVTASFRTGLCGCGFGRRFDPSSKSCLKSCSSYGNDYTQLTGIAIKGYNEKILAISDPDSCAIACSAETSFVCTMAESVFGTCRLSPGIFEVVNITELTVDDTANLFQRHCAFFQNGL